MGKERRARFVIESTPAACQTPLSWVGWKGGKRQGQPTQIEDGAKSDNIVTNSFPGKCRLVGRNLDDTAAGTISREWSGTSGNVSRGWDHTVCRCVVARSLWCGGVGMGQSGFRLCDRGCWGFPGN